MIFSVNQRALDRDLGYIPTSILTFKTKYFLQGYSIINKYILCIFTKYIIIIINLTLIKPKAMQVSYKRSKTRENLTSYKYEVG